MKLLSLEKSKNFLIIGLTGPVGSGSTTTAKFLAGENLFGFNAYDALKAQCEEKEISRITKTAYKTYHQIDNFKMQIAGRLSINLGPYKGSMIDQKSDPAIQSLQRKIRFKHGKLKIYLRKREVQLALKRVHKDWSSTNSNLNDKDRSLFGANPFIYISMSFVIFKLAICQYMQNGKDSFTNYFIDKIRETDEKALGAALDQLRHFVEPTFNRISNDWESFKAAEEFIKGRYYQLFVQQDELFLHTAAATISKMLNGYYDFLLKTKEILSEIKKYSQTSGALTNAFSMIMQDWGDNLRGTGNPFLPAKNNYFSDSLYSIANEINLSIKLLRFRLRYMDSSFSISSPNRTHGQPPTLFVIEAFRNPYEVDFFRSRYAEFYLLSIYAPKATRLDRVPNFDEARDVRDQGNTKKVDEIHKLDVTTCVLQSDIAIKNDKGTTTADANAFRDYISKLFRYLALIWQPGCVPPSDDELCMHLAYSMSCMSTCLSRRVGAVIIGPQGYILGAGWNDVGEGQIGCGLRRISDYKANIFPVITKELKSDFYQVLEDHDSQYVCYKDLVSKTLVRNKIAALQNERDCSEGCVSKLGRKLSIKRLEYCRALHAEENALLQLAKIGGQPIKGGTIYTTSFPCELCAKKIYQTGISSIVFTEPFPESISENVFLQDGSFYIELRPFEGVKSNSFFKLFHPVYDKKEFHKIFS